MVNPLPTQQARVLLCAQFCEHLAGQLPPVTLDADDQFPPDALEGLHGVVVVESNARRQQRRYVLDQAAREILQHALFGHRARDRVALERQAVIEARDELIRVHGELVEPVVQIEEVAVLAPLLQCAQFRTENLLGHRGLTRFRYAARLGLA